MRKKINLINQQSLRRTINMGRRGGFISTINYIARESAKAQRRQEQNLRRAEADNRRRLKEKERALKAAQKENKLRYIESRFEETEDLNNEIKSIINDFQSIIKNTLKKNDTIDFETLKDKTTYQEFNPPFDLVKKVSPPNLNEYINNVGSASLFARVFKIQYLLEKHKTKLKKAEEQFQIDLIKFNNLQKEKEVKLNILKTEFEEKKKEFDKDQNLKNIQIDSLKQSLKEGKEEGVLTYFSMVLEKSDYPDYFNLDFDISYVQKNRKLLVNLEIPNKSIIPEILEYSYNKTKDQILEKKKKKSDIDDLYEQLISSLTLRTIHEIFESDQFEVIQTVEFSGDVYILDKAIGKEILITAINTIANRQQFLEIDLSKIDPLLCVQGLQSKLALKKL
jgi:restriction system protein